MFLRDYYKREILNGKREVLGSRAGGPPKEK
jgi:hypothetical protein